MAAMAAGDGNRPQQQRGIVSVARRGDHDRPMAYRPGDHAILLGDERQAGYRCQPQSVPIRNLALTLGAEGAVQEVLDRHGIAGTFFDNLDHGVVPRGNNGRHGPVVARAEGNYPRLPARPRPVATRATPDKPDRGGERRRFKALNMSIRAAVDDARTMRPLDHSVKNSVHVFRLDQVYRPR
jgi:hypothetical protein